MRSYVSVWNQISWNIKHQPKTTSTPYTYDAAEIKNWFQTFYCKNVGNSQIQFFQSKNNFQTFQKSFLQTIFYHIPFIRNADWQALSVRFQTFCTFSVGATAVCLASTPYDSIDIKDFSFMASILSFSMRQRQWQRRRWKNVLSFNASMWNGLEEEVCVTFMCSVHFNFNQEKVVPLEISDIFSKYTIFIPILGYQQFVKFKQNRISTELSERKKVSLFECLPYVLLLHQKANSSMRHTFSMWNMSQVKKKRFFTFLSAFFRGNFYSFEKFNIFSID